MNLLYRNAPKYHNMEVMISRISEDEKEIVDIRCYEETDCVRDIAAFARSRLQWAGGSGLCFQTARKLSFHGNM